MICIVRRWTVIYSFEETRKEQTTLYGTSARVFYEQRHKHDTTTAAYNITTCVTSTVNRMTLRLANVYHHARGRELRGVSTSPEARG